MQEHRRNGWYVLGGAMITLGLGWLGAWGVAVYSSGPPHPLRYLVPATYVFAGVALAGILIVLAVMYDWFARLPWWPRSRETGLPLKAEAGSPHFHHWNYAASVVALPVRVTNRTNAPVTLPGGLQIEGNVGDTPSWRDRLTDDERARFLQEIASQERTSHHQPNIRDRATIPAHSFLDCWYVEEISRDQRGVHLDMTLHFKDADGNQYSAVFKQPLTP